MNIINTILGIPLGYIVYAAYQLLNNYGVAIIVFTLITRVIVFPISYLTHRNSIRLLQIQPSLNLIKKRWSHDKERLNEEQYNLFKKEKYSPFLGVIPLIVQFILVIGVMQVMYNPLQHLFHLDKSVIDALIQASREFYGTQGGYGEQLRIIDAMHDDASLSVFQTALAGFPGSESILQSLSSIDLRFLGLNMGEIPSLTAPTIALIVPFISGCSSLSYCLLQSYLSPGALSQNKATSIFFTVFTVVISLYFVLITPLGVGIYWIFGNILSMVVLLLLYGIYSPRKYAGEALAELEAARKTPAQLLEERKRNKELKAREKQDGTRFSAANKKLVFFALTSGQYKYYKEIIDYILENTDIVIHYITNDPDNALFGKPNERILPYYYKTERKMTLLMLRLECDIFVTTVPELGNHYLKRSASKDDIEYIYIPHGIGNGLHTSKEGSGDNYDTLFCVGPHQVAEMRCREKLAGIPRRNLVKAGYGLYDQLVRAYKDIADVTNERPKILIAPSWQDENILDLCVEEMLESLLGNNYNIIVRPHPQYTQIFPERMSTLADKYSDYTATGELTFELDFSGNESIFSSDILITDWSGIAYEFSFCTLKPCIYVNTPMKVINPNYKNYDVENFDLVIRDIAGVSINPDEIETINKAVARLLTNVDEYKDRIEKAVEKYLYHPGNNGKAGGKYIIERLKQKGQL